MDDRVGQFVGNYQLLRLLGRGSFAEVYLGEHRYLDIACAIKILLRLEAGRHETFRREARLVARLEHPHIIRVRDYGIQQEMPYLVMDYMPNGTLRTRHPKGSRLPLQEVVDYTKQIAQALDYAHSERVIHRDIKPENILLNHKHEALLSDFGIAVVQQVVQQNQAQSLHSAQDKAGTPPYMAPEQIQGYAVPASDQYALAVMVYEWLCGEVPFRGPLFEVFTQHLHADPPSLCKRCPEISPEIEDAVFGALAKDPQQRFSNVQEFALALNEACFATRSMPAIPAPVPVPERRVAPTPPHIRDSARLEPLAPHALHAQISAPTTPAHTPAAAPPAAYPTPPTTQNIPTPLPLALFNGAANRQRLIRRVRAFWIEGVLADSLQGTALLSPGLQTQPDAVANPWRLVFQWPDRQVRPLAADTSIVQVYDSASEGLLILGAPGAGKSTLMLVLAHALLERAARNPALPVPVIFNLSFWTSRFASLQDWLVEELSNKYQVPRKLAQSLVRNEQILPLLDGLDEVEARGRIACIHAINLYRQEHGLLSMVVCSRISDYLAQPERLLLPSAVTIQPLTCAQVDSYLAAAGEDLQALRLALHKDTGLRELAATPLMLNLLTVAYWGMPIKDLLQNGVAPTRHQVFERYIDRMLATRPGKAAYTPEQTRTWLSLLATQLKQHGQNIFHLERLQPSWLPDLHSLQLYNLLAVRLPGILIGVLISIVLYLLFSSDLLTSTYLELALLGAVLGGFLSGGNVAASHSSSPQRGIKAFRWTGIAVQVGLAGLLGLIVGASFWLTHTPSRGLLTGTGFAACYLLCKLLLKKQLTRQASTSRKRPAAPTSRKRPAAPTSRHPLRAAAIRNGLCVGLLLGLCNAVGSLPDESIGTALVAGFYFAFIGGLEGTLISILLGGQGSEVRLTDKLNWKGLRRTLLSRQHLVLSCLLVALCALSAGVLGWLISSTATGLLIGAGFGIILGLNSSLLLAYFRGVSSEVIQDLHRAVPNQGIRNSALNAFVYGLVAALFIGLGTMLAFSFTAAHALLMGISAGLLAGLLRGGLASLQHYMLRLFLWRRRAIPWNYAHFLDTAVERVLLRRIGGGYIFLHRLLLDHFSAQAVRARAQQSMPGDVSRQRTSLLPAIMRSQHKT